MPKGYTRAMKAMRPLMLIVALALSCSSIWKAHAEETDPGLTAAVFLLKEATKPQRDASHNAMLLGLRQLEDPSLLPLFQGLRNSPYLSMRVHGQLGAAALSPQRRIDLTALAEIEDQRELVQILSAAIDDELIGNEAMATLLTWDGLALPLRQAIALRLMGAGGEVDTSPFKESLAVDLNPGLNAAKLLQYALAALLLAESGDDAGKAALDKLANVQNESINAIIGQTLDAAMRQGFASVGPLALTIAQDSNRDPSLRLLAIQSALRVQPPGAPQAWQAMFKNEESTAQRIRLAMIALDASEQAEPAMFDTLANNGQWIGHIADAGRAIANKRNDLGMAFEPLIATGQPLSIQWVVTYCQREQPVQGPALLELVIRHYNAGSKQHSGRMMQAAIDATTALCEHYPDQAKNKLAKIIEATTDATSKDALTLRQIVLMGVARARSSKIAPLAEAVAADQHNDFTADALRLFIRARHDAPLTSKEWERLSDIVQGVGQFDESMRLQLGWAYLKHKGQGKAAIAKALR